MTPLETALGGRPEPAPRATGGSPSIDLTVYKGHGTENDFVIVEDLDARLDLTDSLVRALCDRRAGIGGDGVLRLVRSRAFDPTSGEGPEFFMDYRNADGSAAEMCGNGARVFVRYLLDRGLADLNGLVIGTRAGAVAVRGPADGEPADWIGVRLGPSRWLDAAPEVSAPGLRASRPGIAVGMPNPHVVVFVDPAELDALDLTAPPVVDPPLPHGQNVEFVERGVNGLRMRVHERGVGETRSCGTGIAAVAVAATSCPAGGVLSSADGSELEDAAAERATGGDSHPWRVEVPGGVCVARWQADGHVWLSGPAAIVAEVKLDPAWLDSAVGGVHA